MNPNDFDFVMQLEIAIGDFRKQLQAVVEELRTLLGGDITTKLQIDASAAGRAAEDIGKLARAGEDLEGSFKAQETSLQKLKRKYKDVYDDVNRQIQEVGLSHEEVRAELERQLSLPLDKKALADGIQSVGAYISALKQLGETKDREARRTIAKSANKAAPGFGLPEIDADTGKAKIQRLIGAAQELQKEMLKAHSVAKKAEGAVGDFLTPDRRKIANEAAAVLGQKERAEDQSRKSAEVKDKASAEKRAEFIEAEFKEIDGSIKLTVDIEHLKQQILVGLKGFEVPIGIERGALLKSLNAAGFNKEALQQIAAQAVPTAAQQAAVVASKGSTVSPIPEDVLNLQGSVLGRARVGSLTVPDVRNLAGNKASNILQQILDVTKRGDASELRATQDLPSKFAIEVEKAARRAAMQGAKGSAVFTPSEIRKAVSGAAGAMGAFKAARTATERAATAESLRKVLPQNILDIRSEILGRGDVGRVNPADAKIFAGEKAATLLQQMIDVIRRGDAEELRASQNLPTKLAIEIRRAMKSAGQSSEGIFSSSEIKTLGKGGIRETTAAFNAALAAANKPPAEPKAVTRGVARRVFTAEESAIQEAILGRVRVGQVTPGDVGVVAGKRAEAILQQILDVTKRGDVEELRATQDLPSKFAAELERVAKSADPQQGKGLFTASETRGVLRGSSQLLKEFNSAVGAAAKTLKVVEDSPEPPVGTLGAGMRLGTFTHIDFLKQGFKSALNNFGKGLQIPTEGLEGDALKQANLANRRAVSGFEKAVKNFGIIIAKMRDKALQTGDVSQFKMLESVGRDTFLRTLFEGGSLSPQVAKAFEDTTLNMETAQSLGKETYTIYKNITGELSRQQGIQNILSRGEQLRNARVRSTIGLFRTIRGLSFTIGGFAVGIAIGQQLREAAAAAVDLERELAGIKQVLPTRSDLDVLFLRDAIIEQAQRYGTDLIDTARAAKIFAQTGIEATEVVKELEITLKAQRGLGVTTELMQELQVAIRAVVGEAASLNATAAILDKISRVESRFAITSQNIADALKLASPVVNQFADDMVGLNDVFDLTIGLSTAVVEQLRVTGNQAGNAIKFIIARLARPEILKSLQEDFQVQIAADEAGTQLLPLQDILQNLADRYQSLTEAQRQQFAVLLAGGRRINFVLPILNNFDKVLEVAGTSATAFGDINDRVSISLDTFGGSLERLNTNFKVFTESLTARTGLIPGLKQVVDLFSTVLSLSAKGPLHATGIAGGAGITSLLAFQGVRGAFNALTDLRVVRQLSREGYTGPLGDPLTFKTYRDLSRQQAAQVAAGQVAATRPPTVIPPLGSLRSRGPGGRLGALASFVTPVGTIIGTIILALLTAGAIDLIIQRLRRDDRLKVKPRSLEELGFFESTQFQQLQQVSEKFGFSNTDAALKALTDVATQDSTGAFSTAIGSAGLGVNTIEGLARLLQDPNTAMQVRSVEGLRLTLGKALLEDLPQGTANLKSFGDAIAGISTLTQLVSGAALAANASFINLQTQITESARRYATEIVDSLDTNALEARIVSPTTGLNLLGAGLTGTKGTTSQTPVEQISNAFKSLFGPDFQAAVGDNAILMEALNRRFAAAAENSETLAEALGTVIDQLNSTTDVLAQQQRQALVEGFSKKLQEQILEDVSGTEVFGQTLGGATDTGAEIKEQIRNFFQDVISDAQADINQQLLDTPEGERAQLLQKVADILNAAQFNSFNVALVTGTQKISAFRDEMIDFITRIRNAFDDLRISQEVGTRFGQFVDVPERRFGIAQDFLTQTLTLRRELENRIIVESGKLTQLAVDTAGGIPLALSAIPSIAELEAAGIGTEALGVLDPNSEASGEDSIKFRIRTLAAAVQQAFEEGTSFDQLIRDNLVSPEARGAIDRLRDDLSGILKIENISDVDDLIGKLREFFTQLGQVERAALNARADNLLAIKQTLSLQEVGLNLQLQQTNAIRDTTKRFATQFALRNQLLNIQRQALEQELLTTEGVKKISELSDEARRRLLELEGQQAVERKRQLLEFVQANQDAFTQQFRSNIESAMSGFKSAATDLDFFAGLADDPDGIRNVLKKVLDPVGSTFQTRLVENLAETAADALENNDLAKRMFGSPEVRLLDAMQTGGIFAASQILEAFRLGGLLVKGELSGKEAQAAIAAGTGVDASVLGTDATKNAAIIASANIGSSLLGGVLANSIGKESNLVGTFSGLGSTLGLLSGLGPVAGPVVGSIAGALLGAFFGKDKKEEEEKRQIVALQAIEKAQIETISAIDNQTSQLLNPQNRLINAPTGFAVPAFNPGGGGGMMEQYNFDFSGMSISGASPAEVQISIEDAVVNAISQSRRTTSRAIRRF